MQFNNDTQTEPYFPHDNRGWENEICAKIVSSFKSAAADITLYCENAFPNVDVITRKKGYEHRATTTVVMQDKNRNQ